jgi:hypothetical protein
MTSPYLLRVRSAHEIVAQLIAARETELATTSDAEACRVIEFELDWLRRELLRLDSGAGFDDQC